MFISRPVCHYLIFTEALLSLDGIKLQPAGPSRRDQVLKKINRRANFLYMLASRITLQFISCYKSSFRASSLLIVLQFLILIYISYHTINDLSWNFSYRAKNSHTMLQLLKLHNSSYHATVFISCYSSYHCTYHKMQLFLSCYSNL
jgi:hypothetical protein